MFTQLVSYSPWYIYLLCVLSAAGLTGILYFKNPKHSDLPKWLLIGLQLNRFFCLLLVLLLLTNFYFKQVRNKTERPLIAVVLDNSASILIGNDSVQLRKELPAFVNSLNTELGDKFEVSSFLFGSKLVPMNDIPQFNEKESDLDNALSELETRFNNRNLGAVILISDGIYNKGANPLYRAERSGMPFYTLALGDTLEKKDIVINKVVHNQIAYLGNSFQVEVRVIATQFKGKTAELRLLQNKVVKARKMLTFSSENYSSNQTFTLNAEQKGLNHYQTEIDIFDDEKNKFNNRLDFVVDVLDNREKILLLAQAPHPDLAALRESILNNSAYELECAYYDDFKGSLKAYSLVLFHGPNGVQKPLIETCRNNNLPFWVINPMSTDIFPGLRINGIMNRYNDAEVIVNPNFDLFRISDDLNGFLKNVPAVKCPFGNYLLSNSSNSLLYQKLGSVETEQPLLVFNEYSGSKSACFTGDGLWKWKLRDFAEHEQHQLFNELISSTVQYLAVKSDKSFFRLKAPRFVNENEEIEFEAEVYNKSYEPISNSEVGVIITNSKNETFKYAFSNNGHFFRANLGQMPPGEYTYVAKAITGNEQYQKTGKLFIKELNIEKINTVAEHQLLFQIANRSGGKMYTLKEGKELIDQILNNKALKSVTYSESKLNRLIEWPLIFWLLLLFFSAEWWIRKRYLTI